MSIRTPIDHARVGRTSGNRYDIRRDQDREHGVLRRPDREPRRHPRLDARATRGRARSVQILTFGSFDQPRNCTERASFSRLGYILR